jgi:acetoin utilization deacetylase AcuC-like enzyme
MQVYFDAAQRGHRPGHFIVRGQLKPVPEVPERADILLAAATKAGHDIRRSTVDSTPYRRRLHGADYLAFLETGWTRWQALPDSSPEVMPNVHPDRRDAPYPRAIVGQAGFHMADTAAPLAEDSWTAIVASADSAVAAASSVRDGTPVAYALCRPPGHHAFADQAGGFCYLNNSALAAECLRERHARVAIVDVDLHHGNGTQGIFYERADVLTVSIHADPADFYPFFWGHANETGVGDGAGCNVNCPLPLGSGDAAFVAALDSALERVRAFDPGALVVALGFDAHESDPFKAFRVTTGGFGEIARRIGALGLPTVLVQEGGYVSPALGENLVAFLAAFGSGPRRGGACRALRRWPFVCHETFDDGLYRSVDAVGGACGRRRCVLVRRAAARRAVPVEHDPARSRHGAGGIAVRAGPCR